MRLIYFAPVPFASYGQRPHFLVRAMAALRREPQVLWVDPYPTRWPQWSDLRHTRRQTGTGMTPWPGLQVVRPWWLPIEPLPGSDLLQGLTVWRGVQQKLRAFADERTVIGVGRPSKLALWALSALPARARFFDAMDDFPAFYRGWSRWAYQRTEAHVAGACNLIVCSSPGLVGKWRNRLPGWRVEWLPNAYSMSALPPPAPRPPSNRIGFVGTMASWFDWSLVVEMARKLPESRLVLAGPIFSDVPDLPANVELLPPCPVERAIEILGGCAAGIIPFSRTPLTDAVDPVKYYEIRALGLPVWTTAFGAMGVRINQPGVWQIDRQTDWRALWSKTLAWREAPESIAAFRHDHDWARRGERLVSLLDPAGAKA